MNRISALTIFLVMFIPAIAWAQVDTLQLAEIGSIQAPSEITELYVEDLDGDSLKEIIICTDYYVYIYDSQTYQVEWTSPPLNHPMDLLFEDINNDSLIDVSVKDSTNIHLFDPHTPQTIWTSPGLDSTYRCYTIDDRNDDDWIDVLWTTQVATDTTTDYDTIWTFILNGPDFQSQDIFFMLMENYIRAEYGNIDQVSNIPDDITVSLLSSGNSSYKYISIYSLYYTRMVNNPGGHEFRHYMGIFYLYNSSTLEFEWGVNLGEKKYTSTVNIDNRNLSLIISRRYEWADPPGWSSKKYIATLLSADSVVNSFLLMDQTATNNYPTIRGYTVGEINSDLNEIEVCYGIGDSLRLYSTSAQNNVWELGNVSNLDSVLFPYNSTDLFSNTKILIRRIFPVYQYRLISGIDGSLSAVFPLSNFELTNAIDLYGDRNDEILSIQGSSLFIYNLDYATDVGYYANLPHLAFLRPNYPNPFNSSTTIEYGLPVAGRVRIDIYDLLGRKVGTLVDEDMPAGRHEVMWDASGFSSGVYFYRIEAGDFVDTKRMVYLK